MRQVVRALAQNEEGKYLLVQHHKSDMWTLPGGHMDPGEGLHKALKREMKEEFRVKIDFLGEQDDFELEHIESLPSPLAIYKIKYSSKKFGKTKKIEYIFHIKILNSKNIIKQEDEIKDYKFFDTSEIQELENIYPQILRLIEKI